MVRTGAARRLEVADRVLRVRVVVRCGWGAAFFAAGPGVAGRAAGVAGAGTDAAVAGAARAAGPAEGAAGLVN